MNKMRFVGKTCLVNGCASGMGLAIAKGLALEGGNVLMADINFAQVQKEAEALTDRGLKAKAFYVDVSKPESVHRLAEDIGDEIPTVLVNCVGIGAKGRENESFEDCYTRIMEVNLYGSFRCATVIGERMIENGGGTILSIASQAAKVIPEKTRPGRLGEYGLMAYCTSKAGICQLNKAIAILWANYGIRANTISPGYVDTPLTAEPHSNPEIRKTLESKIPLHRIAAPEDISETALFLVSDDSAYITGQDIIIDGGFTSM